MKIVVLAGGTGSIAIQTALYHSVEMIAGKEDVDVKILVNAYDSGLSTGMVRKVMNGNILGPSDVRKNQTTRLKLEQPKSPWHAFLDIRFSKPADEVEEFCNNQINILQRALEQAGLPYNLGVLDRALKAYFDSPLATKIDYDDFSLANIIYAGLAKLNKNSLRAAASEMAKLLGIRDNVLLNDDTSLFLGAITESGIRVTDEGDIVSWGRLDDPFVDIFFTDARGNESKPVLCQEAHNALIEADLIILSSGTQWSSLIPTYASSGFKSVMDQCDAKIIMVMNRIPDKDSPGQSASDIIEILVPQYFPEGRLHVVCDSKAHPIMKSCDFTDYTESIVEGIYSYELADMYMQPEHLAKHSPAKLAKAIAKVYWDMPTITDVKNATFVFDYDNTLVGRGNTYASASKYNVKGISLLNEQLSIAICTGNSIKAIKLAIKSDDYEAQLYADTKRANPILRVFADGGVNEYAYSTQYQEGDDGISAMAMKHLDKSKILGRPEISLVMRRLKEAGIPVSKIENRGDTVIAIKPIDPEYRDSITRLLELIFLDHPSGMKNAWGVTPTGRTTIEISKSGISKVIAVKHLLSEDESKNVIFIGDELDYGNDYCIKELAKTTPRLTCLKVKSPAQTSWLIETLIDNLHDTISK